MSSLPATVLPERAAAARRGAPDDSRSLIESNLPLVGHIVREVLTRVPSHVRRDDLVSAGMYGLAAAGQNYDASHNVSFANYAATRIRGAIGDELRGRDWASRSVRGKARELEEIRNTLTASLGRTPTPHEIAATMGVSVADVQDIQNDVHRASVLSLQAITPIDGDAPTPIVGDNPETVLLRREQLGSLRDAVETLPERLRTVITAYFFEQRTMVDIADELGVSESRISQLRSEALGMLRVGMKALDGELPVEPAMVKNKRSSSAEAARAAYVAAVTSHSDLAGRLSASNLLGEPVSWHGSDVTLAGIG